MDILGDEGIDVEEAADGTVAVEMLKEKVPDYFDFVLMDIQMPIMNGHVAKPINGKELFRTLASVLK